jgi:hypothetical protein
MPPTLENPQRYDPQCTRMCRWSTLGIPAFVGTSHILWVAGHGHGRPKLTKLKDIYKYGGLCRAGLRMKAAFEKKKNKCDF